LPTLSASALNLAISKAATNTKQKLNARPVIIDMPSNPMGSANWIKTLLNNAALAELEMDLA
jgi:hypothetical protein